MDTNKDADPVVIGNWASYCPVIRRSDLGWSEEDKKDALSDDPHEIFDYYWHNAFKITFYYVDDRNFYELFMESDPHKFWRIPKDPNWNGQYVSEQIHWEPHEEGKVLFTFDDDTDLWNTLSINGVTIGKVLERSFIAEIG